MAIPNPESCQTENLNICQNKINFNFLFLCTPPNWFHFKYAAIREGIRSSKNKNVLEIDVEKDCGINFWKWIFVE